MGVDELHLFASAYDTDDVAYRLATFVQITGSLILAAGIPRSFDARDFSVVTFGYVVMRIALVGQWLRAGAVTGDLAVMIVGGLLIVFSLSRS